MVVRAILCWLSVGWIPKIMHPNCIRLHPRCRPCRWNRPFKVRDPTKFAPSPLNWTLLHLTTKKTWPDLCSPTSGHVSGSQLLALPLYLCRYQAALSSSSRHGTVRACVLPSFLHHHHQPKHLPQDAQTNLPRKSPHTACHAGQREALDRPYQPWSSSRITLPR